MYELGHGAGDQAGVTLRRATRNCHTPAASSSFVRGILGLPCWPLSLVSVRMKRPGARWKHTTGDEVMQLRALQLSDRWTQVVQCATRPLAKPVQIMGVLGVRAAANANRNADRSAVRRVAGAEPTGCGGENGADDDRCRKAGFCNEVKILEPHAARGAWIQYCDASGRVTVVDPNVLPLKCASAAKETDARCHG
jgi:hypothetical protein